MSGTLLVVTAGEKPLSEHRTGMLVIISVFKCSLPQPCLLSPEANGDEVEEASLEVLSS